MKHSLSLFLAVSLGLLLATSGTAATPFFFSTGNPDGKLGSLSRPGNLETETADDFVITAPVSITQATFVGIVPTGVPVPSGITGVEIELYHVFPNDSVIPPSGHVPTRVNSPGDHEFAAFSSATGAISFTVSQLSPSFTVLNHVENGIFPSPLQLTHGEGPVTGQEVQITVTFNPPLFLTPNHYFFRPEVQVIPAFFPVTILPPGTSTTGDFLWLSAPKPIVAPGTSFPAGSTDLQAWVRNGNIAPDWLRIGTDIVGGPDTFNMTFSLTGNTVPMLEYDFFIPGTTTVGASFLFPSFVRDVSPASVPIPGFNLFIPPSPTSLVPCDLTSNSSAELDCRAPTVHSGIFYFVFDYGAFPTKLGPFTGGGFVAPDGATPSIGTVPLLNGQIIALP